MRLHRDAALSLALHLLSEPRHGAGERLDERTLSALGRGARSDDRCAGALVSGAERFEIDDGPSRLRRWWKPRSHDDARQDAGGSKSARVEGLALSATSSRSRVFACRARRY